MKVSAGQNKGVSSRDLGVSTRPARREGGRAFAWILAAAGVLVIFWMWRQEEAPERSRLGPPMAFDARPRSGGPFAGSPRERMASMMSAGPYYGSKTPSPFPRYYANLSTSVGDYVVSIRQVMDEAGRLNLFATPADFKGQPPLTSLKISLQIMGRSPQAMQNVHDFGLHLTAADDAGGRLQATDNEQTVIFPNGMARIIRVTAPAPGARALKWVEGEIEIAPYHLPQGHGDERASRAEFEEALRASLKAAKTLKFRIPNVPLPANPLVFGVAAARFLHEAGPGTPSPIENGAALTGAREEAVRKLLPPYVEEAGPLHLPTRLILLPERPNRFMLTTVGENNAQVPLLCELSPRIGADGEIRAHFTAQEANATGPAYQADIRLWDNEPLLIALAPQAGGRGTLAVWFDLYLDVPAVDQMPLPRTLNPFQARSGQRGGALIGKALVGERPFGLGSARMEITRVDGAERTEVLEAPLDKEGNWHFANLSPGRYRVKLLQIQPYVSKSARASAFPQFLRHRFGIANANAVWRNETQECVVRMGDQTTLQPWQVVDTAPVSASANP